MKYTDLVSEGTAKALAEMGIEEPTGIQEKALPLIKEGKDVIGMSKTGSGKTAAFGIPIVEKISRGKGPQVIVLAPIRELAVQIAGEFEKFSKYNPVKVATIYGGVGYDPQIKAMKTCDVIVATPGRMLDHLQRGNAKLNDLKIAVLDEADKMVDMGFIEDVDKILQATPKKKQVLLFGATLSHEIERLKARHMHDPIVAKSDAHVKEEFLKQFYYNVKTHEKFSLLAHLLKKENTDRSIIFCAKRTTVDLVGKNLRKQGFKVEMIHGKMSQSRRLSVMENFKKGNPPILVASAVAARGMDIDDVTHVFNYDLSQDPQEYIHRVGRTARAGESGKAITLLSENDYEAMNSILRTFDVNIKKIELTKFPRLRFDAQKRTGKFGRGRTGGNRFSGKSGGRNFSSDRGPNKSREDDWNPRRAAWNNC